MNRRGTISYLCAAALAFGLWGCTLTRNSSSSAPKAQGGNKPNSSAVSSNTTNKANLATAAPKAQPQPEKPKIAATPVAPATNRPAPVSAAAAPRTAPQPAPVNNNRTATVQATAPVSVDPPDALIIRADPATVSKADAAKSHLAAMRLFRHRYFKWIAAICVLALAYWYVRRRSGGSKGGSKASKLALAKPATIAVTDFPTE